MKKYTAAALLFAAVLTLSPAAGCSDNQGNSSQPSSSSSEAYTKPFTGKQADLADTQVEVSMAEEANENETTFKLNSVIDSGITAEDGRHYIYLDVVIGNSTNEDYNLNTLNNFYIMLPDESEVHFDVRTQIYAEKNFNNYTGNPIIVPANSSFSGYIGGFLLEESVKEFTVCFFPTQNDERNKSSLIKVPVKASEMISTPADMAKS